MADVIMADVNLNSGNSTNKANGDGNIEKDDIDNDVEENLDVEATEHKNDPHGYCRSLKLMRMDIVLAVKRLVKSYQTVS